MKRRQVGRDAGLTARMAIALALVLAGYAGIAFGVVELYRVEPGLWWWWSAALLGLAATGWFGFQRSPGALLRRGRSGPAADELAARLGRLASLASLPAPQVSVIKASAANAFTAGLTPSRSAVAVTTGLLELLDHEELDAVLAHELTHVANRDCAVMTIASGPRTFGSYLVWEFPLWFFGLPIAAWSGLVALTLSRYREFAADRGSALMTGAPEHLMSALTKLSGAEITAADLRVLSGAEALCIVPMRLRRFAWLADHPPLEARLAHLAEISRHLGKLA